MLAPSERAPDSRSSPLPLPAALVAAERGPVAMADDPCEAALGSATPSGPRKYYRARYYDPKLGRFISEDPIPLDEREVEELNAYTYVRNNPVNFVDPEGLQACLIIGRTPFIFRQPVRFPNQGFNEGARHVRPSPTRAPTPSRRFSPKEPRPPDLTETPKGSKWKQFMDNLSDFLDELFSLPPTSTDPNPCDCA